MSERNARLLRKWVLHFGLTDKHELDMLHSVLAGNNRFDRRKMRRGLLRGLGMIKEPREGVNQLPRNKR